MKIIKKLSFILITFAIFGVAFIACNKDEQQTNDQTNGEALIKKPIASTDLKTGVTTFTYSIEEYQLLLDQLMNEIKDENDFVFESIDILENNAKSSIPELTLECSVIDVSRERSIVIWLNDEFFDIVEEGSSRNYYFKQDVVGRDFSFLSHCASGTYLISVTGDEYHAELFNDWNDAKSNRPPKKRQVSCERTDCQLGTCQPTDFGDYGWGCNPCTPAGTSPKCTTHIAPDDIWWRILVLIVTGASGIGPAFL